MRTAHVSDWGGLPNPPPRGRLPHPGCRPPCRQTLLDADPPRRSTGPGSQTGSDIIQSPPSCGQTNTCENITLTQTSFAAVKIIHDLHTAVFHKINWSQHLFLQAYCTHLRFNYFHQNWNRNSFQLSALKWWVSAWTTHRKPIAWHSLFGSRWHLNKLSLSNLYTYSFVFLEITYIKRNGLNYRKWFKQARHVMIWVDPWLVICFKVRLVATVSKTSFIGRNLSLINKAEQNNA